MTAIHGLFPQPTDAAYGYAFGCEGLMTIPETAEFLGVGRSTIYRLIKAGKIRKGRIGAMSRICKRSLLEFANSVED